MLTWPKPSTTPSSARIWLAVTTSEIALALGSAGAACLPAGCAGEGLGAIARRPAAATRRTRCLCVIGRVLVKIRLRGERTRNRGGVHQPRGAGDVPAGGGSAAKRI